MASVYSLDLSPRAFLALMRAGIETVEQLQKLDDEQLMRLRGIGEQSLAEIRSKIGPHHPTPSKADLVRRMADEQMAHELYKAVPQIVALKECCGEMGLLQWLQMPVVGER